MLNHARVVWQQKQCRWIWTRLTGKEKEKANLEGEALQVKERQSEKTKAEERQEDWCSTQQQSVISSC